MKPIFIIITAILASIAAAYGTVKLTAPQTSGAVKESTYSRVMRTKTIRCGYAMLEPLLRKDVNTGALSGLNYDLLTIIGQKLNLKIEWTGEAGFASMTQDLVAGRYDMICSTHMITSARAQVVDFSTPIIFSPLHVFVRSNDDRFDTQPDLLNASNITFSTIEGTAGPSVIRDFFPKAKVFSLPELSSISETLLSLHNKKVDATLVPAYEGLLYAEKNNGALRPIVGQPVLMMPYALQIPQNEYPLKTMVDNVLEELRANGTIERLTVQHGKYPGALYPSQVGNAPITE